MFDSTNYPPWFSRMASMYENYEMLYVRISWVSSYSKLASGAIYVTYNSNPNEEAAIEPQYMLSQQGSRATNITSGGSIIIPKSAYTRTPSKRPCNGEGSWLFDLGVRIETTEQPNDIRFFIEYEVIFRTPQLNPAPSTIQLVRRSADDMDSEPRATGPGIIKKIIDGATIYGINNPNRNWINESFITRGTDPIGLVWRVIGDNITEVVNTAIAQIKTGLGVEQNPINTGGGPAVIKSEFIQPNATSYDLRATVNDGYNNQFFTSLNGTTKTFDEPLSSFNITGQKLETNYVPAWTGRTDNAAIAYIIPSETAFQSFFISN